MDHRVLPDLIVLLEAVRSGSLTKAARNLHTVQSNVTARIRILEQAVGVALLDRHARGVSPTAAGEAAAAIAERAAALVDDLRTTFSGGRGTRRQKLRLGTIETIAASQLPSLVGEFQKLHPQVDVTVQAGSSAKLIRRVKDGELDAAFVSRPARTAGLRERVAFRDQLAIVAPRGMSSFESILDAEAPGAKVLKVLVQRLDCSYTKRLTGWLDGRGRRYRLLDLGTLEAVLKFVELGSGIAAMPLGCVRALGASRAKRFSVLKLPRELHKLESFIVSAAEGTSSNIADQFVAFVDKHASRTR